MSSFADRRDTRRVIVGPEFGISFTLKGHAYTEVRITNLSLGGCFALVGARDARLFERSAVLENLILMHPAVQNVACVAMPDAKYSDVTGEGRVKAPLLPQ